MNPLFDRECSSGCESGWTLYFEHEESFLSPSPSQKSGNSFVTIDGNDEEDLSMVSDASSGPPHFCVDEYYGDEFNNNGLFIHTKNDVTLPKNNGKIKKKNNEHRRQRVQEQQISFLDDTASSPIFNLSNNNVALSNIQTSTENLLDFSHGDSSTQFENKSKFEEHYGYCKSPAS